MPLLRHLVCRVPSSITWCWAAVASFALASTGDLSAQSVDYLFFAGQNWARLAGPTGDPRVDYATVRGVAVGGAARFRVHRTLFIRTELQYAEKGARLGDAFRINLRYLELPVLVEYSPLPDARLSPAAVLGFFGSREVGCSGRTQDPYFHLPPPPRALDCAEFRSATSDFGWIFGLSGVATLGGLDLIGELRHVRGRRDLTGFGNTNRSTSFLVGVRVG